VGLIPGLGGIMGQDFCAILKGRVTAGRDRVPVEGVTIRVGNLATTTDESGYFELRHRDFLDRRVVIRFQKEGFRNTEKKVHISRQQFTLGAIRLMREFYLTGRIVSKDMNASVPAACVRVIRPSREGGNLVATTDTEGNYRLGPLIEGQTFRVQFSHPSYLPVEYADQVINNDTENSPARVVLAVGGVISGETLDIKKKRLSGLHVMVYRRRQDGTRGDIEKAGLSGRDGTFLIQGLFPGPKVVVGEMPEGDQTALPVKVVVPPAGEVSGVKLVFIPGSR